MDGMPIITMWVIRRVPLAKSFDEMVLNDPS